MHETGRLKKILHVAARRAIFDSAIEQQVENDLPYMVMVDRAHLVMLVEQRLVDYDCAVRLLEAIAGLEDSGFSPLQRLSAPRGLFLLYEDYLIEKLGARYGGILQMARSRNDLNATVLKMRLRGAYSRLLNEALKLQAALLIKARRHASLTMPIYTHGQAGMPGTYGHYLIGVAQAISRDLNALEHAVSGIGVCPLGAGAAGGTTVAIDVERTAQLLGFDHGPSHSLDAVASRDLVLRLLAASAILGVTLSRLASDFFQWMTAEFGFLILPDHLAGSSSAMPQKRNPFLLEHIKGRSASAMGAFVAAAMAMHSTPFSNSVAVGTEAVRPLWSALQDITTAALLQRLMVAGAAPNETAMLARAEEGFVTATELANRVVIETGLDYRTAHRSIGEAISATLERHGSFEDVIHNLHSHGLTVTGTALDPASVAARTEYGGGPGLRCFTRCFEKLNQERSECRRRLLHLETKWRRAAYTLKSRVREICVKPAAGEV
jgi:argininosuccinate lyase